MIAEKRSNVMLCGVGKMEAGEDALAAQGRRQGGWIINDTMNGLLRHGCLGWRLGNRRTSSQNRSGYFGGGGGVVWLGHQASQTLGIRPGWGPKGLCLSKSSYNSLYIRHGST